MAQVKRLVLGRVPTRIAAVKADKSLRQLALDAGISDNYIYAILDTDRCSLAVINHIAAAAGISPSELLQEVTEELDAGADEEVNDLDPASMFMPALVA